VEIPDNSLDAFVDTGLKQAKVFEQLVEKQAIRVHKVFAQNEDGRELLEIWKESLMMTPSASPNSTQIEIGIAEGIKQFVRNIIIQTKQFEDATSGENNE
jgi:hypothetical protein